MEASELFGICAELASQPPSADASRRLQEVIVLSAAEGCRRQGGAFGNLFSQIDFLSKKLGLSARLTREVQTARRHSNGDGAIAADDWPYDLMAAARFVSAVFHQDVPAQVLRLLPVDSRQQQLGFHIDKQYIRCIVSEVGDALVTADTDDGPITIDYRNTQQGRDFAYLQKLLRPGMQLNLLDCSLSEADNIIVPGQVVVEPDFLIDISSLAACFTSYGHHPLLYTINRLKERPNTQAILLGLFAGAALDAVINQPDVTTAQVLQRSFREQALRYCSCPDFKAEAFRLQAEAQMQNIRQAVALLKPEGALLEPSFVCERLGLQGRVDLMTEDMSLLVEQKAGKNMKIEYQSHDRHGLQREDHYVQLLLYYGVLRYNFGKSDRQVDTRLLYSRYPAAQGLLSVNYYRTLLREAIRLRNQIVATELLMAREGVGRILSMLNADIIYKDVERDGYFHRFVLPGMQAIQQSIASLQPLERSYVERILTFVYREQVAQRLGSSEMRLHHSGGCIADLWQMSLAERQEAGSILLGLSIVKSERSSASAGYDIITLRIPDGLDTTPNFRRGDMVCLYAYDTTPDVRHSILYKGSLQELKTDSLVVALSDGQQNESIFRSDDGRTWAVERDGAEVGTSSAIRSLYHFATASPSRKALLLCQRQPEADTSLCLSRPYHPDYDDVLLRIKQARDYFLLQGPPGTGKTSMALRFIVEEELASLRATLNCNILLTAYTNRAVDEICAMLSNLSSLGEGQGWSFLRLGRPASCDPRFRPYLLDTALATTKKLDEARQLIERTPIIVATTSTLQAQPYIFQLKHFSLAIVDEASQILEPAIIGLLASDTVDRFVLVGDHKQLPAVVQQSPELSRVDEPNLCDIGLDDCRHSLFERLLRWEHRQGRSQFVGILHSHGRMHPEVARFPISHFYQREALSAVPLPHQQETSLGYSSVANDRIDQLLQSRRMLFFPLPTVASASENDSLQAEATLVADLLQRIHHFTADHFNPQKTVGVIVTYRHQIALIRLALEQYDVEALRQVSIDTVERYQGSQRDIIIYSFGVTHRYQLDFLTATTFTDDDGTLIDRKLNVALTRARLQTIVVGRPDLLRHVPLFRQLMDDFAVL